MRTFTLQTALLGALFSLPAPAAGITGTTGCEGAWDRFALRSPESLTRAQIEHEARLARVASDQMDFGDVNGLVHAMVENGTPYAKVTKLVDGREVPIVANSGLTFESDTVAEDDFTHMTIPRASQAHPRVYVVEEGSCIFYYFNAKGEPQAVHASEGYVLAVPAGQEHALWAKTDVKFRFHDERGVAP